MKKVKYYSLIFFVVLLFSFCSNIKITNAIYEDEPNDSFVDANEVPENGIIEGELDIIFDVDIWSVVCASNSDLKIKYLEGALPTPFLLTIFREDSGSYYQIHEYIVPYRTHVKTIHIATRGTYYIKIRLGFGPIQPWDYKFQISSTYEEDLGWLLPLEDYIEFGPNPDNNSAIFEFKYYHQNLDNVSLFINGTDYGDVTSAVSPAELYYEIFYSEEIDGNVTVELVGYRDEVEVIRAPRNFTFVKLKFLDYEIMDQGVEFLGNKLYSILYDPNGDLSYSGWKEGSKFSLGVGFSIAVTAGITVKTKYKIWLFSGDVSFSIKTTKEEGYDFRFETSEISEIRSGQKADNPNEIGPGYGDYYWGEVWYVPWKLAATHKIYWNDTEVWIEPTIEYGIKRTSAALINHAQAPEEWRKQNLYPDYPSENVTWLHTQTVSGGGGVVNYWEQIVSSEAAHHSLTIEIGGSVSIKIFDLAEVKLELSVKTKIYEEVEEEHSITRFYSISDNDENDIIINNIGYDKRFGTFVFRTSEACFTSNPLEHNTVDYHKPIVYEPVINYDSSGDGVYPCENDEPLVVAQIADEGGIQQAWINYTINDGYSWIYEFLTEQAGNPGFWEGQIPSQEHGTEVQWYIVAKDFNDQKTKKMDVYGNPFSYTVINRAPDVELISPEGGETYTDDELTINWTGTDPDGDDLTYSIAYNFNNDGWHSLVTGLTNNSYIWDISGIDYIENVQIRITTYDDYGGEAFDLNDFSFSIKRVPTNATGFYLPGLTILSILALILSVKIIKKRR